MFTYLPTHLGSITWQKYLDTPTQTLFTICGHFSNSQVEVSQSCALLTAVYNICFDSSVHEPTSINIWFERHLEYIKRKWKWTQILTASSMVL